VIPEEGVTLLPKAIRELLPRARGSAPSRPFRAKIGLKGQSRIPTNPGGRAMAYLNTLFIEKNPNPRDFAKYNPEKFAHIGGTKLDNPYLDEDHEESSLGHLDPVRFSQLAEGKWDVFEGQFFPDFDRKRHVLNLG
jgi:hypothetical protein